MTNNKKAIRLLELFKNLDADMSVSCALAMLYAEEENHQRDVETRLGLSNAAASRNVAYWSAWRRHKVPGQGMIDQRVDPADRRYRLVEVTPRGRAFLSQIHNILED